jgi:hypothetical protein
MFIILSKVNEKSQTLAKSSLTDSKTATLPNSSLGKIKERTLENESTDQLSERPFSWKISFRLNSTITFVSAGLLIAANRGV